MDYDQLLKKYAVLVSGKILFEKNVYHFFKPYKTSTYLHQ